MGRLTWGFVRLANSPQARKSHRIRDSIADGLDGLVVTTCIAAQDPKGRIGE